MKIDLTNDDPRKDMGIVHAIDISKCKNMKATIKKVTRGKNKGQFRFILTGDNGENLSPNETYTQKHNVTEVLEKYFPLFTVEDKTK